MRKKIIMTLLGVFSACSMAFAEEQNFTGTVVTANGEPIMGATVTVTGTTLSTITDMDGKFSLVVPDGYSTVTITYSGMKKQVVAVQREPIMLYASAEAAEAAKVRLAKTNTVKQPTTKRSYKKNAFNIEFSVGNSTEDDFADDYWSVNMGWKHQFSQYLGWHVVDFGASTFTLDSPQIDDFNFSATTGLYVATPAFKGLSLFAEVNVGAAYVGIEECVRFVLRPRVGINLGKWVYVAYKYEHIGLEYEYKDGSYLDALETHNFCIGFNF